MTTDHLRRLVQAATPFCGCRIVVEVQTYASDSTIDIRSENRAGSNPRLAQCEFHAQCSPAVLLALLDEVEKKEMALRGCLQLACDGDEVDQTVNGFMGLLHQIANRASEALTREDATVNGSASMAPPPDLAAQQQEPTPWRPTIDGLRTEIIEKFGCHDEAQYAWLTCLLTDALIRIRQEALDEVERLRVLIANACVCANVYRDHPTPDYSRSICPIHQDRTGATSLDEPQR